MSSTAVSTPSTTRMLTNPSYRSAQAPFGGEDASERLRTRKSGRFPRISFRSSKSTGTGKSSASGKIFGRRKSLGGSSNRQRAASMNDVMALSSMPFDASSTTTCSKSPQNNTASESSANEQNVMHWLETTCPEVLLPHIMAYAGPKKLAILSKTNRHWNQLAKQESTWRVLCEELYKWKPGDREPYSWADYYRRNPCVPVDYTNLKDAFQLACAPGRGPTRQVRSVKIWLRPGRHHIMQALQVRATAGVQLTLETMELPANVYRGPRVSQRAASSILEANRLMAEPVEQPLSRSSRRSSSSKRRHSSIVNLIRCMRPLPNLPMEEPTDRTESETEEGGWEEWTTEELEAPPKQATLVLRTRRQNEPVFCVRQGHVALRNMAIEHTSGGLDIWNGNAAVQVQPPMGPDDQPLRVVPRPSCTLDHVDVTSRSGRGIVNIYGGHIALKHAAVHDCAATGVYVGGPGSSALMAHTDVVRNGVGNRTARRGIARGHSGVYLEQGRARIVECNISENCLTGISAVSPENAILNLTHTDLVSNGTFQLELPSPGTVARRESVLTDNRLAAEGVGRPRSGLLTENA